MSHAEPGERYQGWVRSFKETWGFLNADGFQGDLFVGLKSNPQIGALRKEDLVEFEVRMDDRGKPEAINVVVVGSKSLDDDDGLEAGAFSIKQESPAERAQVGHLIGQQLTGRIKRFRHPWGFVNSESFIGDLFVHRRHLTSPEAPLGEGDLVQFIVAEDSTSGNGFHAVSVSVLPEERSALLGQTVRGWVKSFRDSWGLLNSQRFDGEVFVGMKANKHITTPLIPGMTVEFEVAEDQKGKNGFQALKVKPLGGVMQPLLDGPPSSSSTSRPKPEALLGERCSGFIKSFKDKWGFVNSNSFDGDLFVHMGENPGVIGLQPGDAVIFEIGQQNNGKLQAQNVQALQSSSSGPPVSSLAELEGRRCSGSVRTFRDGWGFIVSQRFPGDCFVGLKKNLHLMSLNQGDRVEFMVQRCASSKSGSGFEAIDVKVVPHGYGGAPVVGGCGGGFGVPGFGAPGFGMPGFGMPGGGCGGGGRSRVGGGAGGGGLNLSTIDSLSQNEAAVILQALAMKAGIGGLPGLSGPSIGPANAGVGGPRGGGGARSGGGIARGGFGGFGVGAPAPSSASSARSRSPAKRSKGGGTASRTVFGLAGMQLQGWVRTYKDTWGFINSSSFDGDLFVGARNNPGLPALSANDKVMFTVTIGQTGKPEATEVRLL